jgi:hypothetical protein
VIRLPVMAELGELLKKKENTEKIGTERGS